MAHHVHDLTAFGLDSRSIGDRLRGTVTFHQRTVRSIAADHRATLEAALVVAGVGVATAIGLRENLATMLMATLLGWAALSGIVWLAAERSFGTPTSRDAFLPLLRTVGYAQAPAALILVAFVWGLGPVVTLVGTLWSFAATVFAVRHTCGFGLLRSFGLTLAGGLTIAIVGFVFALFTGIEPRIW